MKPSPIVSKVFEICNMPQKFRNKYCGPGLSRPYIDGRANGYRMKFPIEFADLSVKQLKQLNNLPGVERVGFNNTKDRIGRWCRFDNGNLCIWTSERPKDIKIK